MATLCSSSKTLRAYSTNSHRSARATSDARNRRVAGCRQRQSKRNRLGPPWTQSGRQQVWMRLGNHTGLVRACRIANRLLTESRRAFYAGRCHRVIRSSRSVALREGTAAFEQVVSHSREEECPIFSRQNFLPRQNCQSQSQKSPNT